MPYSSAWMGALFSAEWGKTKAERRRKTGSAERTGRGGRSAKWKQKRIEIYRPSLPTRTTESGPGRPAAPSRTEAEGLWRRERESGELCMLVLVRVLSLFLSSDRFSTVHPIPEGLWDNFSIAVYPNPS